MKGITVTVKVVMAMTILVVTALVVISVMTGQNENLVNFGTGTISGSLNNTTG